jgi:DNA repair exonuclease SbcCD nuclease subunit
MGNHDHLRSGQFYTSVLDIIVAADLENVFVYKDITTIDLDGVSFTLLPFRDRRSFNTNSNTEAIQILKEKLPYELASIELKNVKVLVGHLALEGSLFVGDEVDDMQNELFCPLDMFRGYDYVWMGHIHKPQVMKKSPYIAHIGSMDISDFGEMDHKKKIVIFDPKKEKHFEYIDIPTRALRHIVIDVPMDIIDGTKYILNKIGIEKDIAKSIVKLSINFDNADAININRTEVEKAIYDMGAFHIFRIIEERKISLVKKLSNTENIDNTVNEIMAINMFAESNIEKEIRNNFIGLAQSIIKEFSEGTKQ